MEKVTIEKAAALLKKEDGYLVLTHKRPDGDTVGSAAALCRALRKIGKEAYLFENSEITEKYMPFAEGLFPQTEFSPRKIISVDTASLSQFPLGGEKYAENIYLAVDHHMSNTGYGENLCLYDRASCGETVYELILALGAELDRDIADCLYTAVSTDTGCFVYANTTANTLFVASRLCLAGADLPRLNKILFRTKTKARAALDGYIYSNMRFYNGGRVAVSSISLSLRDEMGVTENDLDDVASMSTVIEGVTVGFTLKEQADGVKVSVRTVGDVNANDICAPFGGGGHRQAAGCFIKGSLEEAEKKLVAEAGRVLA